MRMDGAPQTFRLISRAKTGNHCNNEHQRMPSTAPDLSKSASRCSASMSIVSSNSCASRRSLAMSISLPAHSTQRHALSRAHNLKKCIACETPALVCFATQHCPSLKPKGKVTLPHSDSLPDHYTRNNVRDRAMQVIQTRITCLYVHVAGRTRPLVHFACARVPAARNSCTNVRRPMDCMAFPAEAHMYST